MLAAMFTRFFEMENWRISVEFATQASGLVDQVDIMKFFKRSSLVWLVGDGRVSLQFHLQFLRVQWLRLSCFSTRDVHGSNPVIGKFYL